MGISKTELKKLLARGVVYVEFIKKDGSLRKMWCTRDNQVVMRTGHEYIKFSGPALTAQERRLGYVYVYDLQENDTRLLNPKTVDVESLCKFDSLEDAEIPNIVRRFDKQVAVSSGERAISSDDVESVNKAEDILDSLLDDVGVSIEDEFKTEREKLLNRLGVNESDDFL